MLHITHGESLRSEKLFADEEKRTAGEMHAFLAFSHIGEPCESGVNLCESVRFWYEHF